MLILLALPVLVAVAAMHRYLQRYAPSNVLIRSVRRSLPTWRLAAALLALAVALAAMAHVLAQAIVEGAPGWLNLAVLVLAWDSIKVGALGGIVVARRALSTVRRASRGRNAKPWRRRSSMQGGRDMSVAMP